MAPFDTCSARVSIRPKRRRSHRPPPPRRGAATGRRSRAPTRSWTACSPSWKGETSFRQAVSGTSPPRHGRRRGSEPGEAPWFSSGEARHRNEAGKLPDPCEPGAPPRTEAPAATLSSWFQPIEGPRRGAGSMGRCACEARGHEASFNRIRVFPGRACRGDKRQLHPQPIALAACLRQAPGSGAKADIADVSCGPMRP